MNGLITVKVRSDLYGLKNISSDQLCYCIKDNTIYHLINLSRKNKKDGWEQVSAFLSTASINNVITVISGTGYLTQEDADLRYALGGTYSAAYILTQLLTVDGTGSDLDSDLLDSQHGSYYAPITNPTFVTGINTPLLKVTTGAAIGNILISDADGDLSYLVAGATTKILVGGGAAVPVWTEATGTGAPARAGDPTFTGTVNTTTIHGTTLLIDHIGEHTGSHTVVFDNNIGIGFNTSLSALCVNGGVHIGGESAAGDNNLLVDGIATISNTTNSAITNYGGVIKDNYVSQLTGYRISNTGEADFRYLYADELHVKSFIADLEQALAGGQIVAKSVAKIAVDFTIPVAGASESLIVEEFAGFTGAVFVDGDIIRLRQFSRANNTTLNIDNVWGIVVYVSRDATTNPTTQTFTFTRSLAPNAGGGSGTIKTGTLALDYGVSGNGYYEVTAVDGINGINSPYSQFVTWTTHPATGLTCKARIGNLTGIYDYSFGGNLSGYGLYGDNVYLKGSIIIANPEDIDQTSLANAAAAGAQVNTIDAGDGLAVLDSTASSKLGGIAAGATVGATWGTNLYSIPGTLGTPSGTGLFLSSTYMGYYTASAWKTFIKSDGTFAFAGDANNYVTWNGTTLAVKGNITATTGTIGGFTITANELYAGSGATRVEMQAAGGFWAGATAFANAPFSVSPAGAMKSLGVVEFGTGTAVIDGITCNLAIKGIDIWENSYDGDGSAIRINYKGYAGGFDHFRSFYVYNGKAYKIFTIIPISSTVCPITMGEPTTPSLVQVNITGTLTVSGTTILNGATTFNDAATFENIMICNEDIAANANLWCSAPGSFMVPCFASATARNTAIPAPAEGMIVYNLATHHLNIYNGTYWKYFTEYGNE